MANFNRERIPERQPHAKGGGAFGHFQVTNDVTAFTQGRGLPVRIPPDRLSGSPPSPASRGGADTGRDPRGFALKFYTAEGNYDMVGNNTPVFFIRDPLKFPDFIHSQKRRRGRQRAGQRHAVGLLDASPGPAHQVTWLFGDRGIPVLVPAHERLRFAHLPVDQRRRRGVLRQVPLQDQPGRALPVGRPGRGAGRRGRQLAPARTGARDRARREAVLDAARAGHARGGRGGTTASTRST